MAGINDEHSRNKSRKESLAHLNLGLKGIATTDFKLVTLPIIDAALAGYNDDGVTMLTVAKGEDPRGPNCLDRNNVENNADNRRKHAARNKRCHDLLLSLYSPDCHCWKTMTTELAGDGYGLYDFIQMVEYREPGQIAKDEMKASWAKLAFSDLNIKYDHNTLNNLAAKLLVLGSYQVPEKEAGEVLQKFITIVPKAISAKVADIGERYDNNALSDKEKFPAHYPDTYPVRSLQGKAHPQAGKPDVISIGRNLQGQWDLLISNGQVQVQDKFGDIPAMDFGKKQTRVDNANFAGRPGGKGKGFGGKFKGAGGRGKGASSSVGGAGRKSKEITSSDICYGCGGVGHMRQIFDPKSNDGKGGMVPYCPTVKRGVNVDKNLLSKIVYPHVPNPHVSSEAAKQAAEEEEEEEEEGEEECSTDSELEQANFFEQM